ncbi:hypothetical protein JCM10295v2_005034 [Rhodotorula toruloides]
MREIVRAMGLQGGWTHAICFRKELQALSLSYGRRTEMVATSPPATTSNAQRPPVRNKSSSALSTQTIRTLSSTSSGKPRRNRSFTGLAGGAGVHHGHPAGHHAVSFAHHRKNSHGAPHAMKRSGSGSGSARKSSFGLGMTSMEGRPAGVGEDEQGERDGRPQRPALATSRSSSSSTVTAVGGGSRERLEERESSNRGRSRSRSRARVEAEAEQIQQDQADDQRERLEINTKAKAKERLTGSVTSGSDWESATDSPLAIGKKLPDVAKSVVPEGQSALAQGFSQQDEGEDDRGVGESPKSGEGRVTAQDEERAPAPQRVEVSAAPVEEQGLPPRPTGKKPKFQLGASEDQEDDESLRAEAQADGSSTPRQEQSQAEAEAQATEKAVQAVTPPVEGIQPEHIAQAQLAQTDEDVAPDSGGDDSIPPSAMPPAATAILPSLPAMIQAVAPTEPLDAPLRPDADEEQQAAALAAPATPSAPQHLSPPDSSPLHGPAAEPSLAAAAQPELAFPNGPPSGPPSRPDSAGRTRGGGSAEPLRTPAPPTPTSEEDEAHLPADAKEKDRREKAKQRQTDDVSPIRPLPQRAPPTRKASNSSIVSAASTRSAMHRGPAPQFRRTASGIAPVLVDRGATARAELTSPGPESPNGGELRRSVTGDRGGGPPGPHQRTESMSSIRSLRQAAEAATSGPNRQGPGDMRRLRPTETAGGAIAVLGNIAAAAGRTPPPHHESSTVREGALTHAKRSASGYFNALRGFTGLPTASSPSTPPPSSSASAAQRYPIPGAHAPTASSSLGRRSRSSDSPKPPPLVVKFVDTPPPAPGPPMQLSQSAQGIETPSTQPSTSPPQPQGVPPRLSAKHRNASTTSLGPISRTQQKALLARDAPHSGSGRGGAGTPTGEGGAGGATLAPPPAQGAQAMTVAQQQFLALQQQRALNASASNASSPAPTPSPGSNAHGMQKWALGLVREAERIERQYRAVEKWRDPVGESLERVLVVRMRAKRRREDDREKVRRAVEGLQPGQGSAQRTVEVQPKPRRAATTSM